MKWDELTFNEMVVGDLLRRRAASDPSGIHVRFRERDLTYRDTNERSDAVLVALMASGVRPGDAVGMLVTNRPEFIYIYYGLSKLGAIAVTINTDFRGYMLEYVIDDANVETLFVDNDLLEAVIDSRSRLPSLKSIWVVGETSRLPAIEGIDVRWFGDVATSAVCDQPPVVRHDDPNCVVYTSGTTGPSKGVIISNAHAVVKAQEVIRICGMGPGVRLYSPLPLYHSMALLRGVVAVSLLGGSVLLRQRFSASQFWDDVRDYQIGVVHCVFSIPKILKKLPPAPGDSDHTVVCMFNGQHDPEFEERFGVRLIESYGLTEAGNSMYNRLNETPVPGSCGRRSDEWEIRLVDDDDVEVPTGEVGEITLRPRLPHRIMMGYLGKADATVEAWRGLWFHTGDLAYVDARGWYYFRDRKKDAIRRRGENISAYEVEQILGEHPDVVEAVALAHPSTVGEDDLRVVLTMRQGSESDLETFAEYCRQRMPEFMVPRYIEARTNLPRTATGRVQKYVLRDEGLGSGYLDLGDRRQSTSEPGQ